VAESFADNLDVDAGTQGEGCVGMAETVKRNRLQTRPLHRLCERLRNAVWRYRRSVRALEDEVAAVTVLIRRLLLLAMGAEDFQRALIQCDRTASADGLWR
jgi:hypothetical protein